MTTTSLQPSQDTLLPWLLGVPSACRTAPTLDQWCRPSQPVLGCPSAVDQSSVHVLTAPHDSYGIPDSPEHGVPTDVRNFPPALSPSGVEPSMMTPVSDPLETPATVAQPSGTIRIPRQCCIAGIFRDRPDHSIRAESVSLKKFRNIGRHTHTLHHALSLYTAARMETQLPVARPMRPCPSPERILLRRDFQRTALLLQLGPAILAPLGPCGRRPPVLTSYAHPSTRKPTEPFG